MAALPATLTFAVLGVPGAAKAAVDAILADDAGGAAGGGAAAPSSATLVPIAVDASALTEFDSSAIALLLQAERQARARGRRLAVHSPPKAMVQLATLYGVADLLGLRDVAVASGEDAALTPA